MEASGTHEAPLARSAVSWKSSGYPRPMDYDSNNLIRKSMHSWASPLLKRGRKGSFRISDAIPLLSESDDVHTLVQRLSRFYSIDKDLEASRKKSQGCKGNAIFRALLKAHWRAMLLHGFWCLFEMAFRLSSPYALRRFVGWLREYDDSNVATSAADGWMWAVLVCLLGTCLAMAHHQLFWVGMRLGYGMKQQAIAIVQEKLLRLNGATLGHLSSGQIVNLVSNDVRRFDDFGPFWPFLFAGPMEAALVLLLISLEVGFVPAVAGVSTLLMVIPVQAKLASNIARLRAAAASQTDERVRITGELLDGATSVKMLTWERPFSALLARIRAAEAAPMWRMLLIEASAMALMFFCTPLASFVTFAVEMAMGDALQLEIVFYIVALLHLPKLWLALFFVKGVKSTSETLVATRRLNAFLLQPEARVPIEPSGGHGVGSVEMRGADFSWASRAWAGLEDDAPAGGGVGDPSVHSESAPGRRSSSLSTRPCSHLPPVAPTAPPPQAVVLTAESSGAWEARRGRRDSNCRAAVGSEVSESTGAHPPSLHPQPRASSVSLPPPAQRVTLRAPTFRVAPGTLVGVCGHVGAGKTSLLAALLGELQPVPQRGYKVGDPIAGAPVVRGRVAYCQQAPWIEAGTVRDNIVFGEAFDRTRYQAVVAACALGHDIAALPAGDSTEIGERGVNLSGGQKARLALARAAYSRADVYLLDDPLSAVDARVAAVLFAQCIGPRGIMEGATRILVTHQTQWLHACDRTLILRDGALVADGDWRRLQLDPTLSELAAAGDAGGAALDADAPVDIAGEEQLSTDAYATKAPASLAERAAAAGKGPDGPSASAGEVGAACSTRSDAVHEALAGLALAGPPVPLEQQTSAGNRRDAAGWGSKDHPWQVSQGSGVGRGRSADRDGRREGSNGMVEAAACRHDNQARAVPEDQGLGVVQGASECQGPRTPHAPSAADRVNRLVPLEVGGAVGPDAAKEEASNGRACADHDIKALRVGQRLVAEEHREVGRIKGGVYRRYLTLVGPWKVAMVLAALALGQSAWILSEWWLARWSLASPSDQKDPIWFHVYGGLVAAVVLFSLSRNLAWFSFALAAGTRLNREMLTAVLRAPLAFFHTNPTGRVLNVFAKDQGSVDEQLPAVMFDAVQTISTTIGAIVVVAIASPTVIPVFLPLTAAFFYYRSYYLSSSREVKRFEAVTRSPVYASFSASLKGLATIRAFRATARFRKEFLDALNVNGSWWVAFLGTARWVGVRMDLIALCLLCAASLLSMAFRSMISPALLALALTQLLQLSGSMQWAVRQTAEAENYMTSVERMLGYCTLPQERPEATPEPPQGWPHDATLEFEDVQARYRPGLPLVLHGLTFRVPSGSTCGVVGRTGSGKSSLLLTLFDLIEIAGGHIRLGGLDVSEVGLAHLRRQVAVIPQDPLLFSGSVRSNLDPWSASSDAAMWQVLAAVRLRKRVKALGGLDATMAEAGGNLSAGQRQLLCLARALLSPARVLALDEATANVDRQTDALIQDTLHAAVTSPQAGVERVMLVIAHRVDTIMSCDQVLVLADGALVEKGRPAELAEGSGVFGRLVQAAAANEMRAVEQRQASLSDE